MMFGKINLLNKVPASEVKQKWGYDVPMLMSVVDSYRKDNGDLNEYLATRYVDYQKAEIEFKLQQLPKEAYLSDIVTAQDVRNMLPKADDEMIQRLLDCKVGDVNVADLPTEYFNEWNEAYASAMDKYEFGIACSNLYSFVYDDFCDFYLEMSKISLSNETYNKNSTYYTLITILKNILLMIYPFAPFISEEIYLSLPNHKDSIMLESYPEVDKSVSFDISNILFVKETIEKIRAYKVNNELKPNEKIKLFIKTSKNIDSLIPYIQRFTFASSITLTSEEVSGSSIIIDGGILYIQDDVSKEEKLATLNKQLESVLKDIDRSEHLLNNPNFLNKANPNKVKEEQEKYRKYLEQRKLIEEKIRNI